MVALRGDHLLKFNFWSSTRDVFPHRDQASFTDLPKLENYLFYKIEEFIRHELVKHSLISECFISSIVCLSILLKSSISYLSLKIFS